MQDPPRTEPDLDSPPAEDPETEGPVGLAGGGLAGGGPGGGGLLSSVLNGLLLLLLLVHDVLLGSQSPGRSWVGLLLRRSGLLSMTGSGASGLPRVSAELHTRKLKL